MTRERNADGWDVGRGVLTRADPVKGGWELEADGQWGTYWLQEKNAAGVVPMVGDDSVWYTSNLSFVRGLELNGRRLFYATRADADRQAAESAANERRRKQAELDAGRADRDRRRLALPEPFRARLDRYEAANPDWRREFESYELFTVEQAASLAALPKTGDRQAWYERFRNLPYEAQKVEWPDLDGGHSGNTFGFAVQLAYWLEMGWRDQIVQGHGAMTPLVGCAEYGCHSLEVPA